MKVDGDSTQERTFQQFGTIYRYNSLSRKLSSLPRGQMAPVLRNFIELMQILDESLDAAAAKSLQSCPTLCDPIDGSPPGFPVPGILQARTLEWIAISFFNAWKWKVKVKSFSCVRLLATPWTAAYQAPLSMGFSRQEYWSGVPLPSRESLDERTSKILPQSSRFLFYLGPLWFAWFQVSYLTSLRLFSHFWDVIVVRNKWCGTW